VNLVRFGNQQCSDSSDFDVDAAIVSRIECRDCHGVVVDQDCFEADGAASSPVPVWSQAGATVATACSRRLGNDEIDRDDDLFAAN
jgi:hypothetical protein